MRIAVVNDLRMAREALRRVVESEPRHQLAWMAADGAEAIEHARHDRPDLILMDLIMPGVDGVEATRRIMAEAPCPILVVTSSVGANIGKVYEALGLGAVDAVDTPRLEGGGRIDGGAVLLQKIDTLERLASCPPPVAEARAERAASRATPPARRRFPLALIGASTGGPKALAQILNRLPRDFRAGVIIVQHVDSAFAGGLVAWLRDYSPLPVESIEAGRRPAPGLVLVAHTDDHLVVTARGTLAYSAEPKEYCYRPSVDVFFESAARHWPEPGVAAILTGMGRDGARGVAELRRAGWLTLAQDQATSAVWGMPRAAIEAGGVARVLPPPSIASAIVAAIDFEGGTAQTG